MDQQLKQYEFINMNTGNVIAYCSLPAAMANSEASAALERKKNELATANQLNFELIYWQERNHGIK